MMECSFESLNAKYQGLIELAAKYQNGTFYPDEYIIEGYHDGFSQIKHKKYLFTNYARMFEFEMDGDKDPVYLGYYGHPVKLANDDLALILEMCDNENIELYKRGAHFRKMLDIVYKQVIGPKLNLAKAQNILQNSAEIMYKLMSDFLARISAQQAQPSPGPNLSQTHPLPNQKNKKRAQM